MKNRKSEELFQRAQRVLIGGVNSPVRSFKSIGGTPVFIKEGKGAYLFSEDGERLIDYVLSWGPLLFGHAHPVILEAIQTALKNGTSFGAPCEQEIELVDLIQYFFPSCEKIRLVNSGTEATMSAIRLARGYTGRKKILKFNGCYHGHVDSLLVQAGSGGLTFGQPNSAGVLEEVTQHTLLCEFNDIESVKKAFIEHGEDLAGIIVEPIVGNMGVVLPHSSFLIELRQLCDAFQSVLIFDEVMTGFRVSPGGAQSLYHITPDITCLGKVIGGGLPCAAFGGKAEILDQLSPLGPVYQAGTLSGNPLCVAAGIAMLQLLKDQPQHFIHAEAMTINLTQGMRAILKEQSLPYQINQIGSLFTLFFTSQPITNLIDVKTSNVKNFSRFFHAMLQRGVYFAPSQFEANFLSSAHTQQDIDLTLEAFKDTISFLKEHHTLTQDLF
jgi:glutamate-1-semialdehyde 2,1-aminomutase